MHMPASLDPLFRQSTLMSTLNSQPTALCTALFLTQCVSSTQIHMHSIDTAGKVFSSKMNLFEKHWQNPRAKRNAAQHFKAMVDSRIANRQKLGLPPIENLRTAMQLPPNVPRHIVLIASSWTMVRSAACNDLLQV
jgi:hypothetical protein